MAVTPPDQDPLINALHAAAHQPDPARAQALEDQLTARLEQLAQNSKRIPNMQAQTIYTRRPLPQNHRAWHTVLTSAALIICAALVVVFFPRPTPPPNPMTAPVNLGNSPTQPPMTATPLSPEAQATVIPVFPTGTLITDEQRPTILPMTATPLPGQGSFGDATTIPYPTATPFGMSNSVPTVPPFNPADPVITVPTSRLFYIRPTDFTPDRLAAGDRVSLSLPVVTVTHLPNASLMSLLPAGVVELVPVGTGIVILSDVPQGIVTIHLDEPVNFYWAAWARNPDNQALIAFDLLED